MAKKGGKDFLLKMESAEGSAAYSTIGGLRSTGFSREAEAIDATSHGSNQNKELLSGAGIKSSSISGEGIFDDGADKDLLEDIFDNQSLWSFQVVDVDDGITYTGNFKITSYERGGDYNAEQTFSISLESSGAIGKSGTNG
jgi:TP901-1 family phage major tail protein